jgi:two-component system, NarL family, response regulator LiaR
MPTTVAIVEDDDIAGVYWAFVLKASKDLQYLGRFSTAEAALKDLPPLKPDVVLMDIGLPRMSGVECAHELKKVLPAVKIVMLTGDDRDDRVFESFKAGASGYLSKDTTPGEIVQAVIDVFNGASPMSPNIATKVVAFFQNKGRGSSADTTKLTDREREILDLLSKGLLYKQIAEQLKISYQTVNGHIKNIYEKLQVHSRSEAISKYLGGS